MKATLEFNLPEEEFEHLAAAKGVSLAAAYDAIDEYCREQVKYNAEKWTSKSALDAFDDIRDCLRREANIKEISDLVLK